MKDNLFNAMVTKIWITIISFLLFHSEIAFSQSDNIKDLSSQSIEILKNVSWFRERSPFIYEKRWTSYCAIDEYHFQIEFFRKSDFGLFKKQKKTIEKVLDNSFDIKFDTSQSNLNWLPVPNKWLIKSIDNTTHHGVYFFTPKGDSICKIRFVAIGNRNFELEKNVINYIYTVGISDSLFRSPNRDGIDFAGLNLKITTPFYRMGVNNIYCPKNGQMNWTIHNDSLKANEVKEYQLKSNNEWRKVKVISYDTIKIIFNKVEQLAVRVKYKARTPKIFWGEKSDILYVYYLVTHINNKYVNCVLSHYEDQLLNGDVPPPLSSIMSLKDNVKTHN